MQLKIEDPFAFKAVFRAVTMFADTARFDVCSDKLRIRSIDSHDFCYIDIRLRPQFFGRRDFKITISGEAEVGMMKRAVSNIKKNDTMLLSIGRKGIELKFADKVTYTLGWSNSEEFNLPEPNDFGYDAKIQIPSGNLLETINEALAVSREITFEVRDKRLFAESHDGRFSYSREVAPTGPKDMILKNGAKGSAILDYLKTMSGMINQYEHVQLSLGDGMPLKVDLSHDKGDFTFIISGKTSELPEIESTYKKTGPIADRENPSQLSVTKFPEFLKSIGEGISSEDLLRSKYETENGDYTKLGVVLKFITTHNDIVCLSDEGRDFLESLGKKTAKYRLNVALKKHVPKYSAILDILSDTPQSFDDIVNRLKSEKTIVNKKEILLLLGLATWCNSINRKIGLYYFGR